MDPVKNPFVPGAGTQPPELTGREQLLQQAQITLERIKLGRSAKSFIAVGLRGVGKTVLLSRVQQVAEAHGYRVQFIEAHEQKKLPALLVPTLRKVLLDLDRVGALNEHVKRGLRVLKSFMSGWKLRYGDAELTLDVDAETGAADSGDLEADLPEMFAALGRAARARGVPIALIIDELQYVGENELSALIMGLHRLARENLPVMLAGAGLPQVVGLTGRSKSYAERLFDFPPVGPLAPADAERALAEPAGQQGAAFAPAALAAVLSQTQGYPYFLQEWGYHAWNVANGPTITAADVRTASALAIRRLDEGFFRVRFDRLTPREKDYLRAMAELGPGPHRSGDIADTLGTVVQSVGPVRSALIRKGMVYSPGHGDTAFTVPMFDAYMIRSIPTWQPAARAAARE